jgi:hypothetical protein
VGRALVQAENALVQCPNRHLYSNHLTECRIARPLTAKPGSRPTVPPKSESGVHRKILVIGRSNLPKAGTARAAVKAPKAKPQPAYRNPRTAPPSRNHLATFIAPRINIPAQPAYPFGTPSQPRPPNHRFQSEAGRSTTFQASSGLSILERSANPQETCGRGPGHGSRKAWRSEVGWEPDRGLIGALAGWPAPRWARWLP